MAATVPLLPEARRTAAPLGGYEELPPTNLDERKRAIECAEVVAAMDARATPGLPRPNPRFNVGDQGLLARSQNRKRRDRRLTLG